MKALHEKLGVKPQFAHFVNLVLLLFALSVLNVNAGQAPLFEDDSAIDIELTGPLWSLFESREDRKEWPFRLNTETIELDLQVRARGNSRKRICVFPPLRLNFKKNQLEGTLFEGQDKLKLVIFCKKGDVSKADVMEEYAAYRIFSLFSDISFRVRLVNITFSDTDGRLDKKLKQGFGFLIEPENQLPIPWPTSLLQNRVTSLVSISISTAVFFTLDNG